MPERNLGLILKFFLKEQFDRKIIENAYLSKFNSMIMVKILKAYLVK